MKPDEPKYVKGDVISYYKIQRGVTLSYTVIGTITGTIWSKNKYKYYIDGRIYNKEWIEGLITKSPRRTLNY
tara:strand:- start:1577 stop:1792 length:216 start_codon:yes stop_codon:yes gene_type:complete